MTDRHKSSTTITVRVPGELKQRIDDLASKSLRNRQQYLLRQFINIAYKHDKSKRKQLINGLSHQFRIKREEVR